MSDKFVKLSIRRDLVDFVMTLAEEVGTPYDSNAETVHDSLRVLGRDLQKQLNDKRTLGSEKEAVPAEAC